LAERQNSFLGGYRVLDLTDEKGHLCGKLLGDLGADVIKIESSHGDAARNNGPFYHDIPEPEKSLYWCFSNLNKRGITLNLETSDGRELFKRLLKTADFVIESFEPGYMASLGLGYEEIEKIKPDIIMTSISPFGQSGPYAHYKTTDLVGVSMGGMVRLYGEHDLQPNRISAPQFYFLGSIHGAVGSMVAHYHRELTGEGQYVDVSCQQAVVLALMIAAEIWDLLKVNYRGMGPGGFVPRPTPPGPLFTRLIYPCKDGHVLCMLAGGAQAGMVKSMRALVAMANRDGMALELKDFEWEKLDASMVPQEEVDSRQKLIGDFLLTKTKAELLDEAVREEILLIPICTAKDVAECPQLAFREFWHKLEHPELGDTITYPGWPVKWTELPPYKPQRRAPLIGEHNQEIYAKELGLSPEQLVPLKTQKGYLRSRNKKTTKQIFEGIRVADFSWVGVGPQVARELAEHGATVVRVESHKRPDALRTAMPFKDFTRGIDRSAFGTAYNANKYGISLDLTKPKGKEVARRLIKWADVVTDGFTPGSMKALDLDYEEARKIKPDIIYYSTCQMGQHGPLSKFGGYGAFGTAYGGYCHLLGWPDRDPLLLFNNYSDFIAPWYLTITLIGALLYRRRTGKGMYLDQSQVEAGISFLGPLLLDYFVNGRVACRMGNHDPYMAPHSLYPCLGEDRWVAIAVASEEEWKHLCSVMGNPAWTKDRKFSTFLSRKENEEELDRLVGEWTKDYAPHQLMGLLQDAGVPCGVVQTCEDLFNDPQLKERQHFRFLEHKVIGNHAYNAPAYRLSKTPNHIWKAGPCLGEDNEYVYKEILGYTDDEIADMLVEGVITTEADVPEVLMGG